MLLYTLHALYTVNYQSGMNFLDSTIRRLYVLKVAVFIEIFI